MPHLFYTETHSISGQIIMSKVRNSVMSNLAYGSSVYISRHCVRKIFLGMTLFQDSQGLWLIELVYGSYGLCMGYLGGVKCGLSGWCTGYTGGVLSSTVYTDGVWGYLGGVRGLNNDLVCWR